ncbi:hypothetical protein ACWGQT_23275 [Streptomyces yangpuensis]
MTVPGTGRCRLAGPVENLVGVATGLRTDVLGGGVRARTDPFGFRVRGRAHGLGFAESLVVDLPDRGLQPPGRRLGAALEQFGVLPVPAPCLAERRVGAELLGGRLVQAAGGGDDPDELQERLEGGRRLPESISLTPVVVRRGRTEAEAMAA